ncbi:uncharacterized protein C8Q71DRAFT_721067 [Rhodofomes roseus]|uniref:BED-type domain-containing protein n=1 Tax=Rhodofomes roseus TaxID=34475 RepID=A0ABQ8KQ68_9APHY|nr:uncharacterized protein C8Q71DRAFT_721067 [Rhodofomes roseus]KAH9840522.1 hypothetical protein C8Q71DRAFT_721067 [Rhodofomes roseus]
MERCIFAVLRLQLSCTRTEGHAAPFCQHDFWDELDKEAVGVGATLFNIGGYRELARHARSLPPHHLTSLSLLQLRTTMQAKSLTSTFVHSDKEGPKEQPMPAVQAPVARRGKLCLRKADTHNGVILCYRLDLLALNEVPPSMNVSEKTAPADLLPFFNYLDVPVPGWTEKDDWEEAEKTMMAVCSLCDYYYGGLTGSDNLRRHVNNYHREEYMKHIEEKGFPNQLVSYKNM